MHVANGLAIREFKRCTEFGFPSCAHEAQTLHWLERSAFLCPLSCFPRANFEDGYCQRRDNKAGKKARRRNKQANKHSTPVDSKLANTRTYTHTHHTPHILPLESRIQTESHLNLLRQIWSDAKVVAVVGATPKVCVCVCSVCLVGSKMTVFCVCCVVIRKICQCMA